MKISYRPFVRIDLIEAKYYYNTINANLAKQFLLNVKQTKNLNKNPSISFPKILINKKYFRRDRSIFNKKAW